MEITEKRKFYLSEVLGAERLEDGVLNLIHAPCGSGKSEWVFNVLAPLIKDKHKIIYLIDTINGREQFLKRDDTRHYAEDWLLKYCKGDMLHFKPEPEKIVVMTYAMFGALSKNHSDMGHCFHYIVCDEIHNAIRFKYFGAYAIDNSHWWAQERLQDVIDWGETTVIGITATPKIVYDKFQSKIFDMLTDFEKCHLHSFHTDKTTGYTNIYELIKELAHNGGKGICYTSHIAQMKKIFATATENMNVGMFWSVSNKEHPMTQEQLDLRRYILENEKLPDNIDLLIINASSETALNIRGDIDYMIIHNKNEDTRTQARGRYRGNLKTLYVHDADAETSVPDRFLGRYLLKEERDELCEALNKVNKSGRLYKWTTVYDMLLDSGYTVLEKRKNNRRLYMILETE